MTHSEAAKEAAEAAGLNATASAEVGPGNSVLPEDSL